MNNILKESSKYKGNLRNKGEIGNLYANLAMTRRLSLRFRKEEILKKFNIVID